MSSADAGWSAYGRYLEAPPEQVFEWVDRPTRARGWLVLNSLRGGAAGGGTRMRAGLGREEVVYLAKAMELKFAFSGPFVGGGKSGIDFDPSDPRRDEVLDRWFGAVRPFLASRYGTGGDVAVDEQRDVVPRCAALGLGHPQAGILRGHLGLDGPALDAALRRVAEGVRSPVPAPLGVPGTDSTVSDLATGFGVARAAARCLEGLGDGLSGKRVVVEGFGNVGGAAALYMAREGARIVGLLDARHGLVDEEGLDAAGVEDLLRRREDRLLPPGPRRLEGPERERVYRIPADVFVPAAISGSVDRARLDALDEAGVEVIVCGSNHPFAEDRLGATETQRSADRRFTVVADIVASLGMARAFHHLMTATACDAASVFDAVTESAEASVDAVLERAGGAARGLLEAAVSEALARSGRGVALTP